MHFTPPLVQEMFDEQSAAFKKLKTPEAVLGKDDWNYIEGGVGSNAINTALNSPAGLDGLLNHVQKSQDVPDYISQRVGPYQKARAAMGGKDAVVKMPVSKMIDKLVENRDVFGVIDKVKLAAWNKSAQEGHFPKMETVAQMGMRGVFGAQKKGDETKAVTLAGVTVLANRGMAEERRTHREDVVGKRKASRTADAR